jgi:sarcosine oxidase
MSNSYDVIVVGLGAMGSATAAHLARRGSRVLGLDTYGRGHTFGSSHGTSRIIREAYNEAPEYVPLVQRAYTLWRELEEESGRSLLTITGGLGLGPRDCTFVDGAIRSATLHKLPYELLSPRELEARFPGFQLPDDMVGVLEPRAGILQPERCVTAHLDSALRHAADLHHGEQVLRWSVDGDGVRVETGSDVYTGDQLVITTGPWSAELLADLNIPLTVTRIVNAHFQSTRPELFTRDRCPIFLWQVPEGEYYGIPSAPGEPLKLGKHIDGAVCTPHTIRREVEESDIAPLRALLDKYMPGASGPVERTLTCMYTNTPDSHFVLDQHPEHRQLVYGCGFSGHGFKFSSVIGEVLADLAQTGSTRHDIGFLSASRFGATAV